MLKSYLILCVFIIVTITVTAQNKKNPADNIIGKWTSQKKTGIIDISKRGSKFYGKLIWIKDSIDSKTHQPKKDANNPDTKLKDRFLGGLEILNSFQYVGENNFKEGQIYDPESGKTYSCKMHLSDDGGSLEIRGFIGVSLLGRTEIWSRVK